MNCCTQQRGLNQIFNADMARHEAKQFRKKGLSKRDRQLLRVLTQRSVQGATVLEVGGGIGGLEIEMLKAGAAHTTDVDIAQAYVESARELAQSLGFGDVSEQRVLDFAHEADQVDAADIVLMNRVVCCYPDMP
ncbi:MAG: class I SAM-dependent methyltransferase, partial [Chloroflexi bacterium]|nr:class I SAM-dependent methyltransferase [Chloroflexota bacterium]